MQNETEIIGPAVPLSKVRQLLEEDEEDMELSYEKKLALEHAQAFSRLGTDDSLKLIKELTGHEKVSESNAFKLVEHLPRTAVELRPFFLKERFVLGDDEIKQILDIIAKYR